MIFEGLCETKKITDSNTRAIQAWESRIQESTEDSQETASSMVAGFGQRIEEGIGNLLVIVGNIARQQEALAHQQQKLTSSLTACWRRLRQTDSKLRLIVGKPCPAQNSSVAT